MMGLLVVTAAAAVSINSLLTGSFQNTGQASHINNNLAQALALAQQQAPAANMKLAASLAGTLLM